MAGASEKKRKDRNDAKLSLFRIIFLSGLAVFAAGRAFRYFVLGHGLSGDVIINGVGGLLGCAFTFSTLQSSALAGGDLEDKGMTNYLKDGFYLSALTLFVGAAYDRIWKFVFVISILFGAFFLVTTVVPMIRSVGGMMGGGTGTREATEEDKKKSDRAQERRERRLRKSGPR